MKNSDGASHPMIQKQIYDDTILQRRTKFLVSGLLLCFVIAIASLALSIMMLMKGQAIPDFATSLKTALANDNKFKMDLAKEAALREDLEKKVELLNIANNKLTMPPVIVEEEETITDEDSYEDTDPFSETVQPDSSEDETVSEHLDHVGTDHGHSDDEDVIEIDTPHEHERPDPPPLFDYDDEHYDHSDHDHDISKDIFFGSGDYPDYDDLFNKSLININHNLFAKEITVEHAHASETNDSEVTASSSPEYDAGVHNDSSSADYYTDYEDTEAHHHHHHHAEDYEEGSGGLEGSGDFEFNVDDDCPFTTIPSCGINGSVCWTDDECPVPFCCISQYE